MSGNQKFNYLKNLIETEQYREAFNFYWDNANQTNDFVGSDVWKRLKNVKNFKEFEKVYNEDERVGMYTDQYAKGSTVNVDDIKQNTKHKYDYILWSFGNENEEDDYFRFFLNDDDFGISKKQILSKYPKNKKLKDWIQDIEKEKENKNGIGGEFYLTDIDFNIDVKKFADGGMATPMANGGVGKSFSTDSTKTYEYLKEQGFENGGGVEELKLFKWQRKEGYESILKKGFDFEESYERYPEMIDEIKDNFPRFPKLKGFFKSHTQENGLSSGIIVASDTNEAVEISELANKVFYGHNFIYENGKLIDEEIYQGGNSYSNGGGIGSWESDIGDLSIEEILSTQQDVEGSGSKVAISKDEIDNEDGGLSYGIDFEENSMWYGDDKELRDSDYDKLSQLLTFNSSKYSYGKYAKGGNMSSGYDYSIGGL